MIRATVFYPNAADVRFDHQYYAERHRALVLARLGPYGLRSFEVERGVGDGAGGAAPYVAIGHITFDTLEAFQRGWAATAADLVADVPNYTNATPVLQVSEVATFPAYQSFSALSHDQREREPLH